MMCESYVKAFMYVAELFGAAPCQHRNNSSIVNKLTTVNIKAWTASGDGTSYKGVSIGSYFSTFPPVPFQRAVEGVTPGKPLRQFLASTREVNHKTSTQFENWLTLFDDIATIHNDSPSGSRNPITLDDIIQKVTGYSGDHAADQKKLAKEFCERKREAVTSAQGIKAMMSKPAEEVEQVLGEKFQEVLRDVGGWEGWKALSRDDQTRRLEGLAADIRRHFGELDLASLPEFERRIKLLFLWSGCAMHKDLNTFKGGAVYLAGFWIEAGLDGPVKLLNREQEKLLVEGDKTEDDMDNVTGGAVKLASLIGALVGNRDEGKGCSEEFRTYTRDRLGEAISFPDTSNVRYQCYGDAAAEIIRHPDLYIDFVNQHGMKKKGGAGPNHMERNILKGLVDPPTMTEMAVLALYHESVSKPYAMEVRGLVNEQKNALDLGPLHDDVEGHCAAITENPELLIGDNVSHTTGAFHGTLWDQPVVDHILSIRDQLPHLRRALVAFFEGACKKWPLFTEEFGPDSEISQATVEERALGFRPPTNDHCEGAGAMKKQWKRRAPTMATHQTNACVQVQLNGSGFLVYSKNLTEADKAFTRRGGRGLDAAGLPLKENQAQAEADREGVEEERSRLAKRERRKEERKAEESSMVDGFEPILDLDEFRSLPAAQPLNYFLQCQLVWHREVDGDEDVPAGMFKGERKEKMKEMVIDALERRNERVEVDEVDQMDPDVALLPDESEVELELVDRIGLSLNDTERADRSPPRPTHPHLPPARSPNPQIYKFGCRWDSVDYSCSYDCAFMAFAWIYFHATENWRATWAGELPVAKSLSRHFNTILHTLGGSASDYEISMLFSRRRDIFRDALSEENPLKFKRRGPVCDTSFVNILESLSCGQTSSRYVSFIASCGGPKCNLRVTTPPGAHFMLSHSNWAAITGSKDPPHRESLQRWITGYFDHRASSLSRLCPCCGAEYSQTRSFLQPPWIWFEVFANQSHVVLPPFKLSLSSNTYRLAAVVYGNGVHFVARLSTPSGTWWYYDGQANGGRPVADSVTREEDLVTCGGGYKMNALIYCRTR